MKTIIGLEWKRCGTLADPADERGGGVYLMIYEGRMKRVFYVGRAKQSFIVLWNKHKSDFGEGLFSFWRGMEKGDIYALMRSSGRKGSDLVDFFQAQALCRAKLWGSAYDNKTRSNTGVNGFNSEDRWSPEWQNDANKFMAKLALWACPFVAAEAALYLETQIQQALGSHFDLGLRLAADGSAPQKWLGQQERRGDPDLRQYRFEFKSLPDVDEESKGVLSGLSEYLA